MSVQRQQAGRKAATAATTGAAATQRTAQTTSEGGGPRPFRLARIALVVVAAIITYASLRPFTGWLDPGRHPLAWLATPAEFGSFFDAALNAAGYFPLGALLALAAYPRWRGRWALALGALAPALGSVVVEALQTYLPERVSSVVDMSMNALGATLGAALAVRCTPWLADHRGGARLRERWLVPGPLADVGLVVLGVWLVALFAQRTLLFGTGDFRGNLQVAVDTGVPLVAYVVIEVLLVAAHLVVAGLLLRLVLTDRAPRWRALLALLAAALLTRTVAQLAFWEAAAVWRWVTPAAVAGLLLGLAAAALAMRLPRRSAAALAAALLIASVVLVNLAPPDPALWLQPTSPRERLLIGLTLVGRYSAKFWPLFALLFLALAWRRAAMPR